MLRQENTEQSREIADLKQRFEDFSDKAFELMNLRLDSIDDNELINEVNNFGNEEKRKLAKELVEKLERGKRTRLEAEEIIRDILPNY